MRPMRRALALITLVLGLTLLAAPPASAAVAASIENRTSGSPSGSNNLIGIEPRLSEEAVREKVALAFELASDDAVAARAIAPSSRALGRALEAAGHARPPGSAAHHIVAGGAERAAPARAVLDRFGIGINDAANGAFLPSGVHARIHTNAYYETVNSALSQATTRQEALQVLEALRRGLP
jgi:A nuclease family of the HNH/ENDO VII superfamily with conserved AHH